MTKARRYRRAAKLHQVSRPQTANSLTAEHDSAKRRFRGSCIETRGQQRSCPAAAGPAESRLSAVLQPGRRRHLRAAHHRRGQRIPAPRWASGRRHRRSPDAGAAWAELRPTCAAADGPAVLLLRLRYLGHRSLQRPARAADRAHWELAVVETAVTSEWRMNACDPANTAPTTACP